MGFASIVLDLMIGSWVGDMTTEDWRTYSAYFAYTWCFVSTAKTGTYAYVNMTAYLAEPCNIHKFASVTFGFVLSWLGKTLGGSLITILWSDLNSLSIMGSPIQYFGGNASLSLTLISSFVKKLLRLGIRSSSTRTSNSNFDLTGPVWSIRWSESLQANGPWVGQHFKNWDFKVSLVFHGDRGIRNVLPVGNSGVKGVFYWRVCLRMYTEYVNVHIRLYTLKKVQL